MSSKIRNIKNSILDLSIFSVYGHGARSNDAIFWLLFTAANRRIQDNHRKFLIVHIIFDTHTCTQVLYINTCKNLKLVYHSRMDKDNNLVKVKLFLLNFIYRNEVVFTPVREPLISLSLSLSLSRGGERLLRSLWIRH